jgi:murein DD-endopeptidase MepM/ murein hydrolase activator NlpD
MRTGLCLAGSVLISGCALFGNPYTRADQEEINLFKHTRLPLSTTQVFEVTQGAFGSQSHNEDGNEYSWDFAVPLGTDVLAVEGGLVIDVHTPAGGSGCDPQFAAAAHNVKIEHQDGTVAQYVHVTSLVARGSRVAAGQVIARTADNGWLCRPHLHFGIYRSREHLYDSPQRETVPLFFEQVPGGILRQGFRLTDQF